MEDQSLSNNSTQTVTTATIPCAICGVPSRGLVYGAIACEACKAFFKRIVERRPVKKEVLHSMNAILSI